jgi:hypothetical protein
MDKLSAFRTELGTAAEIRNGARKTTCEIDDKNRFKNQFISSQAFHRTLDRRVYETTAEERFRLENFESFDPVTQELYRHLLHIEIYTKIGAFEEKLPS